MRDYVQWFLSDFEYPSEAAVCLLSAFDALQGSCKAEFSELLAVYDASSDCDYDALLTQVNRLAECCGVHPYTARLLLFICFSKRAKTRYLEKGIPEQIWHDNMLDLKWKLLECKEIYGIWGSFVASWFPRFFVPSCFALGRLQFELLPYAWEPYRAGDFVLQPGDTVINVHIPRTGSGIGREALDDAYARAAEFFAKDLNGAPVVFVCSTWLLYPAGKDFLPANSNLRSFMADYDIVKFHDEPDRKWLWRLFDTMEQNPDRLPANSSLRRAYINRLKAGGMTGSGSGIYIYRK